MILSTFGVSQAKAQNAKNCVRTGYVEKYGKQARYIENTCRVDIIVVTCFDDARNIPSRVRCGGETYFQHRHHLRPGQRKTNQVNLVPEGNIYYGACVGSNIWSDTPEMFSNGRYRCNS